MCRLSNACFLMMFLAAIFSIGKTTIFQPQAPQNAKKPKPQKAPVKKKKFMKRGDFWSNVLDLTKIIVPALVTVLAATSAK